LSAAVPQFLPFPRRRFTLCRLQILFFPSSTMEMETNRGRTDSETSDGKKIDGQRRRSSLADQAIDLAHELKEKVVGPSKEKAMRNKLTKQESQEKFTGLVEMMYEANAKDTEKKVYAPVKEEDMLAVAAEEFERFKKEQGVKIVEGSSPPKGNYHPISEIYSH